ncbi:hypothetical protein DMA11_10630 [Marinilabiliaceae bacterium JC017]|nr:hypothetical protein DMA11_10630 [Marinilabiliaceae bacterium JC017]
MSDFRTIVPVTESSIKINYDSKILFMGSCFTENIGAKLVNARFNVLINPFGILYNPMSISQSLDLLLERRCFTEHDLVFDNDLWHSFFHHGRFSSEKKEECLSMINDELEKASEFIKSADFLILTFGTAWVYELKESQRVVSNCHKFPAKAFNRYRLEPEEIVHTYKDLFVKLKVHNPKLKIILTISPVRHWKDGAHGNQVSKAVLLLAVNNLVALFENVDYFPAYELILDDLRDYRFFDEDMLHPGKKAIDYVWERFCKAWFAKDAVSFLQEMNRVIKAKEHRPFNPQSEAYEIFLSQNIEKIHKISKSYPNVDLTGYLLHFKQARHCK